MTTPRTGAAETTNYSTHGTRTFFYDAADNLIEVKDNGVTTGAYGFDALGRRVTKTAGGYEYRFVHAGPWMIEDYRRLVGSSTGTWWIKGGYVHGPGIDNVVMMRHRDWVDKDVDQDKVEPRNRSGAA